MKRQHLLLGFLVLGTLATGVVAWVRDAPSRAMHDRDAQIQSTITKVSPGQAKLVRTFPGPGGLTGVIVKDSSGQHVAWATAHGEAVFAGTLFSSDGADLTRLAMIDQGLVLSPASALRESALPLRHAITVGTSGPLLTVFFDLNCVFCHQLYDALMSEAAAGHVRVRFVIVGTLKDTSVPRAASVLSAKDPAQALAINESGYDPSHEEGGFPIAPMIAPTLNAAVRGNNALFKNAGITGTPTLLYCDKATNEVRMAPGMPADLRAFIAGAGGCS